MENPKRFCKYVKVKVVTKKIDEGRAVAVAYMDFGKAFDKGLHDRLVRGMVGKFADDTKIGGLVDSEAGYLRIQLAVDQLGQQTEEWQMEFTSDKRKVLGFDKTSQ
eukprot:g36239.t1